MLFSQDISLRSSSTPLKSKLENSSKLRSAWGPLKAGSNDAAWRWLCCIWSIETTGIFRETFAERISKAATHLCADCPIRPNDFNSSIAWSQDFVVEYSDMSVSMTGRKRAASITVAAVYTYSTQYHQAGNGPVIPSLARFVCISSIIWWAAVKQRVEHCRTMRCARLSSRTVPEFTDVGSSRQNRERTGLKSKMRAWRYLALQTIACLQKTSFSEDSVQETRSETGEFCPTS